MKSYYLTIHIRVCSGFISRNELSCCYIDLPSNVNTVVKLEVGQHCYGQDIAVRLKLSVCNNNSRKYRLVWIAVARYFGETDNWYSVAKYDVVNLTWRVINNNFLVPVCMRSGLQRINKDLHIQAHV